MACEAVDDGAGDSIGRRYGERFIARLRSACSRASAARSGTARYQRHSAATPSAGRQRTSASKPNARAPAHRLVTTAPQARSLSRPSGSSSRSTWRAGSRDTRKSGRRPRCASPARCAATARARRSRAAGRTARDSAWPTRSALPHSSDRDGAAAAASPSQVSASHRPLPAGILVGRCPIWNSITTVRSEEDLDIAERTVARALRLLLALIGRTVGAEDGFGGLGDDGQGWRCPQGICLRRLRRRTRRPGRRRRR